MIELLDDKYDWPRETAAEALGYFREAGKPAVPRLLLLLKDKNQQVRERAATALWMIDKEAAAKAGVDIFKGKYGE